jgi:hypothetical protein
MSRSNEHEIPLSSIGRFPANLPLGLRRRAVRAVLTLSAAEAGLPHRDPSHRCQRSPLWQRPRVRHRRGHATLRLGLEHLSPATGDSARGFSARGAASTLPLIAYVARYYFPGDRSCRYALFLGIMAVAPPPGYGAISSIEPREHGGNMDNKELTAGARRSVIRRRWPRCAGRRRS